jgi:translocation and assembly module TamB
VGPQTEGYGPRLPMKRLVALAFVLLLTVILAILWSRRMPIAADFIDRELARRGVQATYQVKRIGFRTQRFENLVIGDPRRPDLTARWVEVDLSWGFRRPQVSLIRARGVRMFGRVADGKLSLGQIDRLLPPPTGLPFRLPNQAIDVADAAIRLDTPAGRIGIALDGRGNLAGGFRGKMAAVSRQLALGGCRLAGPAAHWAVAIDDLKPSLAGPVSAANIACGADFEIIRPHLALAARLEPALDEWNGSTGLRAAGLRFGDTAMADLGGRLSFAGNARDTRGRLVLGAASARVETFMAARTSLDGQYAVSAARGRFTLVADARAGGVSGGGGTLGPVVRALASAGGTPLGPIGDALAAALARFQRGFDIAGSLSVVDQGDGGAVRFERLSANSRSGASLALSGGQGFTYQWPDGATRIDGDVALSGGGFPAARFSLAQPRVGDPIRGVGRIAPVAAAGARLALGEIRFTAAPGGTTRIDTVATLDGPFNDGRVTGLVLPVSGRFGAGGFAFGERCLTAGFRSLQAGGLRLGPTRLPLCPIGRALIWQAGQGRVQGGGLVPNPRLAGQLGQSPVSLAASQLRFGLAEPGFAGSNVAIRLGRAGAVNRLDIGTLSGRFNARGVVGGFAALSGKLANVPLLLSEGRGSWRVQGGNVEAGGSLLVADEMNPPRFYPLVTRDFRLTLRDNQIAAAGWLDDPQTGTRIAHADIGHSLITGRGRALLEMPGIAFDDKYQPEELTRLTTGVVALVKGVLRGEGRISWDEKGSASSGTFSTDDMDFAAAFGPVEGFSTTLHFTDLLGLASAPGQLAQTGLIRTGIDVFDGRIRYQLLPGLKVKVESGRWPFAGGELILEETILDFSKPSAKLLTFRVVGLDAARFVQQMEFSNISATGTFDGIIPMVFDERGGRIVGGHLVAREAGGTLSYIGELTGKDLGVYGKLAFDALKSLRYNRLVVDLNGSLEGEFIAGIQLDGVARDPSLTVAPAGGISGMVAGRALNQLAKIPFKFNITVKGPFRTLLATTRSLEDPTNLIQSVLPDLLRNQPTTTTVQPEESETKP